MRVRRPVLFGGFVLVLTSTSFRVSADVVARHLESVARQSVRDWRHVYVNASAGEDDAVDRILSARAAFDSRIEYVAQHPETRKGALENYLAIWRKLDDDDVIVMLEGDDWFAVDEALEVVARAYAERRAEVTYGSFIWRDGKMGFARPAGDRPRDDHWRATHLKTFRAGLVKKIVDADFRRTDGEYFRHAGDRALMIPLLEMAGRRAIFVPEILYVYNAGPYVDSSDARDEVSLIRARPRYPLAIA